MMFAPTSKCLISKRLDRRGFSLLEMSIVLMTFAGIISGIWVASGMVRDKVKQSSFSELLYSTSRNVQALHAGKMFIDNSRTQSVMPYLASRNVFPADFTLNRAGVTVVLSPFGDVPANPISGGSPHRSFYVCGWDSDIRICSFAVNRVRSPMFAVEVLFNSSEVDQCINAVMRNSNPATLPGLVAVKFNNEAAGLVNMPLSLTAARNGCGAAFGGGVTVVDFVFKITP